MRIRLPLALLLALVLAAPASAQFSGVFTIGSGGDYPTVSDALDALQAVGVSGPTAFEFLAGSYTVRESIEDIPGVSATQRVTFRAADGANVILASPQSSSFPNYIFEVESDFVTLEGLFFIPSGTTSARSVVIRGDDVTVRDCIFSAALHTGAPSDNAVHVVLDRFSTERALITGNTFTAWSNGNGANVGAVLSTSFASLEDGPTRITRNTVLDLETTAFEVRRGYASIDGNTVTGAPAIRLDETEGGEIVRNKTVGGGAALEVEDAENSPSDPLLVHNNFFHGDTPDSFSGAVVRLSGSTEHVRLFHNTVYQQGAGAAVGIRFTTGDISLENNLLDWGSGVGLNVGAEGSIHRAESNVYAGTGVAAKVGATTYGSPAALRIGTRLGDYSTQTPVSFVDGPGGDLHLRGASIGDADLMVPRFSELRFLIDIDLAVRSSGATYAGADDAGGALQPIDGGTYRMTPSTFGDILRQVSVRGVRGPVTFQLEPGTYTGQARLRNAGNVQFPVRLMGPAIAAGEAPQVTWSRQASNANDYILELVGVRNLTVENIAFDASGGGNAVVILETGGDITFESNTFAPSGIADEYAFFAEAGPSLFGPVTLTSNTFTGGRDAVYIDLAATALELPGGDDVLVVRENAVTDTRGTGMDLRAERVRVEGNRLDAEFSNTQDPWVSIAAPSGRFDGNRVQSGSNSELALHLDVSSGFVASNNNISGGDITAFVTGGEFVHNTLFGGDTDNGSAGDGAVLRFADGASVRNNIVHAPDRPALSLYYTAASTEVHDYNVFDASGPVFATIGGDDYATLAAYQAEAAGQDNSVLVPVEFQDAREGDLHVAGASDGDDRLGVPRLPDVLQDIDGDARPEFTYAGADEGPTPLDDTPPMTAGYTVTNPIADDYFAWGQPINIRWTTAPGTPAGNVSVKLLCEGAAPYVYRASRVDNGAVGFLMPAGVGVHGGPADPDGGCRAEIASVADPTLSGTSELFVVQDSAKAVAITEPTRFDRYGLQGRFHWRWDAAAIPGASRVRLSLVCQGRDEFVRFPSTPNDGNQGYELLPDFGAYANCHAQVAAVDDLTVYGRGMSFEILDEPLPAVEVTAPTAGTAWAAGTTQTIRWQTVSTDANVNMYVFLDNFTPGASPFVKRLAITPNDGAFAWAIPASQPAGTEYRIRLAAYAQDGSLIRDIQFPFTITSAAPLAKRDGVTADGIALERGWTRVEVPTATDAAAWLAPLAADGPVAVRDAAGRILTLSGDRVAGDLRALAAGDAVEVWVGGPAALGSAPAVAAVPTVTPHFAFADGGLSRPAALWTVEAPGLAAGDEIAVLRGDAVVGRGVAADGRAAVVVTGPKRFDPELPPSVRADARAPRDEVSPSAEPDRSASDIAAAPLSWRLWRAAVGAESSLDVAETPAFSGGAVAALTAGGVADHAKVPLSASAAPPPDVLTFAGARPNPVRGAATVRVGLPAPGALTVEVFDLLGRRVAVLADGAERGAGWQELRLDARALSAGVYVVQVRTAEQVVVRRMTVVR